MRDHRDHVREPLRPPVVAGARHGREGDRPRDETGREHGECLGRAASQLFEHAREPEQEVREEDEQHELDAHERAVDQMMRPAGGEREQLERSERAEGAGGPHRRPVAPPVPRQERDDAKRCVPDDVDASKDVNCLVQSRNPPRSARQYAAPRGRFLHVAGVPARQSLYARLTFGLQSRGS